jgi:hypothetical protein
MNGLLICGGEDGVIASRAKASGLAVKTGRALDTPFEKTLIVQAGARVPWDLLPAAWAFLDRWDAAVPLWRYNVLAGDVGTDADRQATAAVVRDLRVPLHAVELLFVRASEAGCALVETWQDELAAGGDKRLAFLRSLYQVKPRLCVLPTTWLVDVREQERAATHRGQTAPPARRLVTVELEPGRMVKCYAGDEERVREQFRRQQRGRR